MSAVAEAPQYDPLAGIAAFEEDLPRVLGMLGADSLEALNWRRPSRATLVVPMAGEKNGASDAFVLRLGFEAYRRWPPSAQFVNPETLAFVKGPDDHHVPQLTSGECHTHLAYDIPGGGKTQLICCSATMEFYQVRHGVEPGLVWSPRSNFYATIRAIERAMREAYQGRFPAYAG